MWLSRLPAAPCLEGLAAKLSMFKDLYNERESAKLDDCETQLAVYEGHGEYYLRHKDAFKLDSNNLKDGQRLRKLTVIAYLNPELSASHKGELRLYLADRIVDVTPRLGRVIVFKSEHVEHEVLPTRGFRRFALTAWYRYTHRAPEALPVSAPDGKIFVGIPAYRDPELPSTIANLVATADRPELLRFGVCFQYCEVEDSAIDGELRALAGGPSEIEVDRISYKEARNAYYARTRVQRLYRGEEFALQIDSHMRMVKGWDSLLKEYISQCPGKPIISVYPRAYQREEFNPPQEREGPLVMCIKEFSKIDGLPRFVSKVV